MKVTLRNRLDRLQTLIDQNSTKVISIQFENAAKIHYLNGGENELNDFLDRKEKELLDEKGNWKK